MKSDKISTIGVRAKTLVASALLMLAWTAYPQNTLCEPGYVVGFFNGVFNSRDQAARGLAAIRDLVGTTYEQKPVKYELLYNYTDAGSQGLEDLAETFIQRADEADRTGLLRLRFEYLQNYITDGGISLWARLILASPTAATTDILARILQILVEDLTTRSVAAIARALSNPPIQANIAEQTARINELVLQGQKVLFVAHSQGNLFANSAYDYFSSRVNPGSIRVVHVAPASLTLRGDYALADIDFVIAGLRTFLGAGNVPGSNLVLPTSSRDPSGHKFIDTYLDPARSARANISAKIITALRALVSPVAQANIGFFTITLTWNGSGDVDLHAFEPNGQHVYYLNKTGTSGRLDVDNTVANGPEHYYATCNPANLQVGTYRIGINNYQGATGRTATVQAASVNSGVLTTKVVGVGPVRGNSGNNSPIPVLEVQVTRRDDGTFEAKAQ